MDALYYAHENTDGGSLEIVMSKCGGPLDTIENAYTHYRNLINNGKGVTPKRPANGIKTYLCALFDEKLKMESSK